ncbi:TetR/AcrR family transcriptional regulator [Mammaliicoccus lentus]|uniref:TetR/AcrR family transcriptional regulator n=1 Tax=Mammaliicoccus lentus TaxID=42858 RepID=UPI001B32F93A|nr:TetR/AcrR family transcriptional regulator [Mammaliicoccus lentus]
MVQDRRIRKSQNAIKIAFLSLLKKENFHNITIQQTIDLADVSRGTFYANYADKYDLLEKMENEKIDDLQNFISEQDIVETIFSKENLRSIMEYLINHIDQHITFYYTMFNMGKVSMLEEKLYLLIHNHLSSYKSMNDTIGNMPFSYFMSYVSGAGISLIKHWVQDESRISKDELIFHFYNIVENGTAGIIKKQE